MTQQLGMALIGAGRIGVSHAGLIAAHPGARLVAVVDAVPEAAEALAAKHAATDGTVTMGLDAALADPAIGAVLIATSTDTHADLIERAAHAGKAILSEKPIDLSLERIDRCLSVVEATGARLVVGLNRRFDPGIAALRAKLDAGAIGRVSQISIVNRDAHAPPAAFLARSGGIFRDMALHDFDLACHLLGESPVSVTADGNALADAGAAEVGDYDAAVAVLTMEGGARVVITNARCARFGFDFRIEVLGSGGVLALGNTASPVLMATESGLLRAAGPQTFFDRFETAFARQFDAFLEVIATGKAPSPTGADGRRASAIAEAAAEAAASGRRIAISI